MSEETELTEMIELIKLVGCSSRNKGRVDQAGWLQF